MSWVNLEHFLVFINKIFFMFLWEKIHSAPEEQFFPLDYLVKNIWQKCAVGWLKKTGFRTLEKFSTWIQKASSNKMVFTFVVPLRPSIVIVYWLDFTNFNNIMTLWFFFISFYYRTSVCLLFAFISSQKTMIIM